MSNIFVNRINRLKEKTLYFFILRGSNSAIKLTIFFWSIPLDVYYFILFELEVRQ